MRAHAVQIQWHHMQTVSSVHFCPSISNKLATAGGDNCVRIWQIVEKPDGPQVEFLSTLSAHLNGVNTVRWNPKGDRIISADNVGTIILWACVGGAAEAVRNLAIDEDVSDYKETWRQCALFNGHKDEVSDLAWSPCGNYFASVGTDRKLRIWDVHNGDVIGSACDHTEMAQGVAWDPLGHHIATQSVDRSVNIYSINLQTMSKRVVALLKLLTRSIKIKIDAGDPGEAKQDDDVMLVDDETPASLTAQPKRSPQRWLYADPTVATSFFRRLSFSPDGMLLACPAAVQPASNGDFDASRRHAVMVYTRSGLETGVPAFSLPGFTSPAWVVHFSHCLYGTHSQENSDTDASSQSLGEDSEEDSVDFGEYETDQDDSLDKNENLKNADSSGRPFIDLPYRMLYAVGTDDTLAIYDTYSVHPRALLSGFHVYRYQDISWSACGRFIMCASHDGYCTLVTMDSEHELAQPLSPEQALLHCTPRPPRSAPMQSDTKPTKEKVSARPQTLASPQGETAPAKRRIQPTLVQSFDSIRR